MEIEGRKRSLAGFCEAEVVFDHSLKIAERHFANQVFGPAFGMQARRRLTEELIEALLELSLAMGDLLKAKGLEEKWRMSDLRIQKLMTRIRRMKIGN